MLSVRLGELFLPGALAAEMHGPGDPKTLSIEESECVRRAVPERRQEFAAGRMCASLLMAEFGVVDFPLRAAADRQAQWPSTLVGSITHTTNFCAAAVAEKSCMRAIGIDSEVSGSVRPELWKNICTPLETEWLRSLENSQQPLAATLLFSAKEAFYKCQYSLTEEKLNFHDASVAVQWGEAQGFFTVQPSTDAAIARHAALPLRGRFLLHDGFVTTGIALR